MELFRNVLNECCLKDVGYTGSWFTWERGNFPKTNIRETLDRGVETDNWMCMFSNVKIKHVPHSFSDHFTLSHYGLGK